MSVAHVTIGAMFDKPSPAGPEHAPGIVAELLEVDFGDWEPETVKELVAARPGWEESEQYEGGLVVRLGRHGAELTLDAGSSTGSSAGRSTRYVAAEILLLNHRSEPDAAAARTAALSETLAGTGGPVRYEDCGEAPGLRWRGERHTVILQSSRRASWLAVHPVALHHAEAADTAESLHDSGRPGDEARVLTYEKGATLVQRREAFGALYDAVVGRIGSPTLQGGSAQGPNIRWRNEKRLLVLAGDRGGAWLEVHDTDTLEAEEHGAFKWGGAWSENEPADYAQLPYLWQLDGDGPGWVPLSSPGGRLAPSLEHAEEALTLLLRAFVEQMPPQLGEHWAGFRITGRGTLLFGFVPGRGLVLSRTYRTRPEAEQQAETMRGAAGSAANAIRGSPDSRSRPRSPRSGPPVWPSRTCVRTAYGIRARSAVCVTWPAVTGRR